MIDKIELRKIQSDKDRMILNSWWKLHGHIGLPDDCYPENSFIAYVDGVPIASGCIYLTDSKVCYIDNLISNPNVKGDIKDLCLDMVVGKLMEQAKIDQKKYWVANAKSKKVLDRAKKFNMTQSEENHYWFTGVL